MNNFGWTQDESRSNDIEMSGIKSFRFDGFIGFFSTRLMGDQYIDYFDFMEKAGLTITRGKPFPKYDKVATFGYDDIRMIESIDKDSVGVVSKSGLHHTSDLAQFTQIANACSDIYLDKYSELLKEASLQQTQPIIERSQPMQGCRLLHSDKESRQDHARALTAIGFLNDDFQYGEIEFWHQELRVTPEPGLIIMFPTDWTHTYRGLPPKGGARFTINSFFERVSTIGCDCQ